MTAARTITLAGWSLIVVLAAFWQARSALRHRPTLGPILRALVRTPLLRAVMLAVWAFLGWHLFVRGTATFLLH